MPPALINNLRKLNKIIEDNKGKNVMDLSMYTFLAPPTLLPLLQYMESNKINKYYPNPKTKHYLEKVLGREKCNDNTIPLRKLKEFRYSDYFQVAGDVEMYLSDLTDEIVELISPNLDF